MRMFSKYIRLKDGTICDDIEKYLLDEEGNYCEFRTFMGINEEVIIIPKDNIEKESDNLEDLCDEFIWDEQIICFSDKDKFHYENDDYIFDLDKEKIKEGIYAAVWTDKGLIYVARMNKDGEWELI